MILPYRARPVQPSPSRLKRQLVSLGLYGLTHDHSQRWVPAITTIISDRRWTHV